MPEVLSLMCVHAHPDDETIATGGTLAKYAAEHVLTAVITATRGDVGEVNDHELDIPAHQTLADIRTRELALAASVLQVSFVNFLGYRDSGMAGTADNLHSEAFMNADMDEACRRLVLNIRKLKPQVLVTYDENGGYGHPDHIMCNRVTSASFDLAGDPEAYWDDGEQPWQPQKLYHTAMSRRNFARMRQMVIESGVEVPSWIRERDIESWGTLDDRITTRIDISAYWELKRKALACHRSQIADSFWMKLPEEIWRAGWSSEECFTRVRSLVDAPEQEDDLFAGLRDRAIPAADYSLLYANPVGTHFVA